MTSRFPNPTRSGLAIATLALTLGLVGCTAAAPTAPKASSSPAAATPAAAPDFVALGKDACEHLNEGPIVAVTAADADTSAAPALDKTHTRYDIALPGTGARDRFVRLTIAKTAEYSLYGTTAMTIDVLDDGRKMVTAATQPTAAIGCDLAKGRTVLPLSVGTYYLKLKANAETATRLVVLPTAGGEHEPKK
jgi:hypothetical protein